MDLERLSDKQRRSIGQAQERINIWHGSVRSGKTLASLIWWAGQVEGHDGNGDLLMVGKTERTLRRNVILPLTELIGEDDVSVRAGIGEATIFGKVVYLVGANDERSEQKIRGGTFARIYGDELTLWPESFFRMATTRMSTPGAKLGGTTNPDGPKHWLKAGYLDREHEAEMPVRSFHFTFDDNPSLPADYLAAAAAEYTGLWRKRFIEGLWVIAEGAIWDAFDPAAHTLDALPEDLEIKRYFVGVDYGTSNPFVALLLGEGSDGRFWVVDEWRHDSAEAHRQLTDAQYSSSLAEWIGGHGVTPCAWYVDPSAASFILQLRQDHGWQVIPAENDVSDGLRHVATLIAADGVRLIGCQGTQDEIASYCWDARAAEKGEDKPVKRDDHGPDALRYALYSDSLFNIGDIEQYGWM